MYKLFLCLTFLHRKVMAYFAVLAVALCVMMLLIATSVMNGFLRQIEVAAKGLFGDVVIDAPGRGGLSHYDQFIAEITRLDEVESATPFIMAYGILTVPGSNHNQGIQIAGIRLPERAASTDFEDGLFVQGGWAEPTFDPPFAKVIARLNKQTEYHAEIEVEQRKRLEELRSDLSEASGWKKRVLEQQVDQVAKLLKALDQSGRRRTRALKTLTHARDYQAAMARIQRQIDEIVPKHADESILSPALREKLTELREQLAHPPPDPDSKGGLEEQAGVHGPRQRVILGLGLGSLSHRSDACETIRIIGPGERIVLSVFPIGREDKAIMPTPKSFTVIDDSKSGVLMFDSYVVYVPFDTLQELSGMGAMMDGDDPTKVAIPPRCGQIHIKLAEEFAEGRALAVARNSVENVWKSFCRKHPDAGGPDVKVRTWREAQAAMVGPIESQRTLVVIMFSLMSLVSVVLIFVIFYTIVVQHTRDIGVIKSLGGSGIGVAGIFLGYGSILGAIGAVLGVIGGTYFVHYVNEIHDWVGRTFGFRVWSAEAFMFDRIPNTIEPGTMIIIALWAVVGGLIGALVPAIRAARMQPVEALRYE